MQDNELLIICRDLIRRQDSASKGHLQNLVALVKTRLTEATNETERTKELQETLAALEQLATKPEFSFPGSTAAN